MASTIYVHGSDFQQYDDASQFVSAFGRCTELVRNRRYRQRVSVKSTNYSSAQKEFSSASRVVWNPISDEPLKPLMSYWSIDFLAGSTNRRVAHPVWPILASSYDVKIEIYNDSGNVGFVNDSADVVATSTFTVSTRLSPVAGTSMSSTTIGGAWRVREKTVIGPDTDDNDDRDDLVLSVQFFNLYEPEGDEWLAFRLEIEVRVNDPSTGQNVTDWVEIGRVPIEGMEAGTQGWGEQHPVLGTFGNAGVNSDPSAMYFPDKRRKYKLRGTILLMDKDGSVIGEHPDAQVFRVPPRRVDFATGSGPGGLGPPG